MRRHQWAALIFYALYLVIYAGWLFHTSAKPAVLTYSYRYLVFLVLMMLGFFVPTVAKLYLKRLGWRGSLLVTIPFGVIVALVYLASSIVYYHRNSNEIIRRFDPFLQAPRYPLPDKYPTKKASEYRILALGGSTTLNAELPPEQRYIHQLTLRLQTRYPLRKISMVNGGMPWFTTKHSLINYVSYFRQWDPDMVIVMHAINDLVRTFSPRSVALGEYNDQWTHYYGPVINAVRQPALPTFERYLAGLLSPIGRAWFSDFHRDLPAVWLPVDYSVSRYRSIRPFERHLSTLATYVQRDGARMVLVTQPSYYHAGAENTDDGITFIGREFAHTVREFRSTMAVHGTAERVEFPSDRSLAAGMEAFNAVVERVAQRTGALLIRAANQLPKDSRHLLDDCHYSQRGAMRMADIVAGGLIRSGLLDLRAEEQPR